MISPDLRFRTERGSIEDPHTASRHKYACLVGRTRPNAESGEVSFTSRDAHRGRLLTPQPPTEGSFRLHSLIECSDRRAPGETESAICVQRLDDSLNSAIHTRYRSLLRSSSMHEPRGPPLEVVHFQQQAPKQTENVLKKKR